MATRDGVYWYEDPEGAAAWLILTRSSAVSVLNQVPALPATRTMRHIPTEVALDEDDGMLGPCVLALDNVAPIRPSLCTPLITALRALGRRSSQAWGVTLMQAAIEAACSAARSWPRVNSSATLMFVIR